MQSSENGSQVYHLNIAPNNDIIFCGTEYTSDWQGDLYAERISEDGEQIWEYHGNISSGDLFSQATSDNSGNTYLVGETGSTGFIYKLNETGELVWENEMAADYGTYYSIFINSADNNNIYCSGSMVDNDGILKPVVTSLTATGEVNWQTLIPSEFDGYGLFIKGDEDGLYQTTDSYDALTDRLYSNMYKLNYDGNLDMKKTQAISTNGEMRQIDLYQNAEKVGYAMQSRGFNYDCFIGISSLFDKQTVSVPEISPKLSFEIYPNPVTNNLVVKNAENIVKLDVISINGQKILEVNRNSKNNLQEINVSQLKEGMYFVKGYTDDGIVKCSKFIKK